MDQRLLLAIQHACNQASVKIPFDRAGAIMGPTVSEGAIIQHLAKLRIRLVNAGESVPPPLKRGGGSGTAAGPSKSAKGKGISKAAGKATSSVADSEDDEDDWDDYEAQEVTGKGKAKAVPKAKKGQHKPKSMKAVVIKKENNDGDGPKLSAKAGGKRQRGVSEIDSEYEHGRKSAKVSGGHSPTTRSTQAINDHDDNDDVDSQEEDVELESDDEEDDNANTAHKTVAAGAPFLEQESETESDFSIEVFEPQSQIAKLPIGHGPQAKKLLRDLGYESDEEEGSQADSEPVFQTEPDEADDREGESDFEKYYESLQVAAGSRYNSEVQGGREQEVEEEAANNAGSVGIQAGHDALGYTSHATKSNDRGSHYHEANVGVDHAIFNKAIGANAFEYGSNHFSMPLSPGNNMPYDFNAFANPNHGGGFSGSIGGLDFPSNIVGTAPSNYQATIPASTGMGGFDAMYHTTGGYGNATSPTFGAMGSAGAHHFHGRQSNGFQYDPSSFDGGQDPNTYRAGSGNLRQPNIKKESYLTDQAQPASHGGYGFQGFGAPQPANISSARDSFFSATTTNVHPTPNGGPSGSFDGYMPGNHEYFDFEAPLHAGDGAPDHLGEFNGMSDHGIGFMGSIDWAQFPDMGGDDGGNPGANVQ